MDIFDSIFQNAYDTAGYAFGGILGLWNDTMKNINFNSLTGVSNPVESVNGLSVDAVLIEDMESGFNGMSQNGSTIIQEMAEFLQNPIGKIQRMAMESELSADVMENVFSTATEGINNKIGQMPMTWEQLWSSFQERATTAFQPVIQGLNNIANSEAMSSIINTVMQGISSLANGEAVQGLLEKIEQMVCLLNDSGAFNNFVSGIVSAFSGLINILSVVFSLAMSTINFIIDNWLIAGPIIYGIIAALTAYAIIAGVVTVINGILAVSEKLKGAAQMLSAGETFACTVAQHGLNAALLACPITWIVMGIIAFIVAVYALCAAIAKMTGLAGSGLGFIVGCIKVVCAAFCNFGMLAGNIFLGTWEVLKALCTNMVVAFHNAISSIKGWFYSLLSTALTTVAKICEALNRLPFISFDYSGIEGAAKNYAAKALEEANNKDEYTDILDAFYKGFHTYEAFKDGWAESAFTEGASTGDGWANKISGFFSGLTGGTGDDIGDNYQKDVFELPGDDGTGIGNAGAESGGGTSAVNTGQTAANLGQTAVNTGQTAANTAAIAGALDITNEQLKYLRDIAERDVVNRYTTASIKVEMTNHNKINSSMDLDGVVDNLAVAVQSAMSQAAEGVHF